MLEKWRLPSLLILLCLIACTRTTAQHADSVYDKVFNFPNKIFNSVDEKAAKFEAKVNRQTEKYLQRLSRQEQKLKRQLQKKDSAAANSLFGNATFSYEKLQNALENPTAKLDRFRSVYDGHLDSLQTSLKFLEKDNLSSLSPELQQQFSKALGQLSSLQGKLNQADNIRKVLQQRQQYLKQQLQHFGMVKAYKKFQKEVFYYQQQVQEYKDLLDDPSKMEKKLLQLASQSTAFKEFFAQNSALASLFNSAGSANNNPAALAGLQTRNAVMQDLQTQLGSGANVQQAMQQNLQSAQSQLNELKNKINQYLPHSGGNSNDVMPEQFKPNNQKTKSFWNRLELGTNLQSQKPNGYFPVTTDLGLSVGYKLNDKSIIGIGGSYKLGWGQNIRNIKISHQGAGLRSFVDVQLKGSFWISGGYELNYQSEFKRIEQLLHFNNWQNSGLIGISKVVSVNSQLFKKTKLQLLWDFLSYQQIPRRTPIVFRLGYAFK